MDFLVQRHIDYVNGPQTTDGTWEDLGVQRNLTADDGPLACKQAATGLPPLQPGRPDRLRAIKWDAISEVDVTPGPPEVADRQKQAPGGPGGP